MNGNFSRNTVYCLGYIEFKTLCVSCSDFILVFEHSLCEVIYGFFGEILVNDECSHYSNSLLVFINTVVCTCGNNLLCIETVLFGKFSKLFVFDFNNCDFVVCSKVKNSCCRNTCNAEECINLTVLESICRRTEAEVLLLDILIHINAVSFKNLLCVEFNTAACIAYGYALACKVSNCLDAAFLSSDNLAKFGVKNSHCREILCLFVFEKVCTSVSVVHNVVLNNRHVSIAYLDKLDVSLGSTGRKNLDICACLVRKNGAHGSAVTVVCSLVAACCEDDLFFLFCIGFTATCKNHCEDHKSCENEA